MPDVVNINGEITPVENARISVLDHGFLFGDSVYETIRTYIHKLFLFSKHFDRLTRSAAALHLPLPWDREKTFSEIQRTIDAAQHPMESRVRLIVTRGTGGLGPDPDSCQSPNAIIFVAPLVELDAAIYETGVGVVISSLYRSVQLADAKTGNLIRQVLALREAKSAGAFEAILLTESGLISDGITSNIYIVKGNKVMTPSRE